MISTLRDENTEPLNIIGLAGQRILKSLDSYSEASQLQQKEMSLTLSEHVLGRPDSDRTVLQRQPYPATANSEHVCLSEWTFSNCTFAVLAAKGNFKRTRRNGLSELSLSTAVTRSCRYFFGDRNVQNSLMLYQAKTCFFLVRSQLSSLLISSNHIKDRTLACA